MIFRTDDISMNTDFGALKTMHEILAGSFPSSKIWSCVNILAKENGRGSVYPQPPFKDKPMDFFFDVNLIMAQINVGRTKLVSHGFWHFDHSKAGIELQEASIVTSCRFLRTNIFVPPFNRYNADTVEVCRRNVINLVRPEEGWRSMEHNDFDPSHHRWYWHPWKWTPEKFQKYIEVARVPA